MIKLTKEKMMIKIEDFDITPFTKENRKLLIEQQLEEDLVTLNNSINTLKENGFTVKDKYFEKLSSTINSLKESGFVGEITQKDSFKGLLSDHYEKDEVLYEITKGKFKFEIYIACGDYNGIDFEVFDEETFLTELKKHVSLGKYEFYKKLLYYSLNEFSKIMTNSDGLGTDIWEVINDEVYTINKEDLEIFNNIYSLDRYSNFIPVDSSLGYEAQFFNRNCEDGNYVSYNIYSIEENGEEQLVESHALEDAHTIVEALNQLDNEYGELATTESE